MLASILNKRLVTLETHEGSAYGSAPRASAGTGEYSSLSEVCRAAIREDDSVLPLAPEAGFYVKAHRTHRALNPR